MTSGAGPWRSGDVGGFEPFPDAALDASIGDRFLEIAGRYPDRQAISSPAGVWTYAELEADVRRWAAAIARSVGTSGESVALVAEHDGPLVVGILSVLVSGNVVVVVDPIAPADQQRHVLDECRAALVIHDDALAVTATGLAEAAGVHA